MSEKKRSKTKYDRVCFVLNAHSKEITQITDTLSAAKYWARLNAQMSNCPHLVAVVVAYHGRVKKAPCEHMRIEAAIENLRPKGRNEK